MNIVYVTGNKDKALYLQKFLNIPIEILDIDVIEIQSLSLKEVVKHKAIEAYNQVKRPLIVEDTSLEITDLNGLPGPLVRWFIKTIGNEGISKLPMKNRNAIAKSTFAIHNGIEISYIKGSVKGTISEVPKGEFGYGFDSIFIPKGYNQTLAQMNDSDRETVYQQIKPFPELKRYLLDIK